MYRPTKSGMGNSVVRLVFVSFDYFSNFQFPEKSSGRGDMTLCQQRDNSGNLPSNCSSGRCLSYWSVTGNSTAGYQNLYH